MKFFPIGKTPRKGQEVVINATIEAIKNGYKNIIIEAPVGSGKSAIAVALTKYLGSAHILTPRKSLQTQYENDFPSELIGMRGRRSYPCLQGGRDCSDCPLVGKKAEPGELSFQECRDTQCPYVKAINEANNVNCVVHNYHSFIFQAALFDKFTSRPAIIFDEAHEIPNILRSFGEVAISFNVHWLGKKFAVPTEDQIDVVYMKNLAYSLLEIVDREGLGDKARSELETILLKLNTNEDYLTRENYVFSVEENIYSGTIRISMTPIKVGPLCNRLMYRFGDIRIFMSGTIFSASTFCQYAGLDPAKTKYIQMTSTFPAANRPVYNKPEYQLDTSFKHWDANFPKMVENIKTVMEKFKDVKGLIHAPSYKAAAQLMAALRDTGRMMIHDTTNIEAKLTEFYSRKDNTVFISPICQQGVDMKYDRAKFQIILRVPYPNTSDPFVNRMLKDNYSWYNYQALITFGQQLGRIVRAEDDFGATVLMDSRFQSFITKNRRIIPKWVMESVK